MRGAADHKSTTPAGGGVFLQPRIAFREACSRRKGSYSAREHNKVVDAAEGGEEAQRGCRKGLSRWERNDKIFLWLTAVLEVGVFARGCWNRHR